MAENRVIGNHNTIPWRIREDMAHFKATTWGHTVLMGRRTYASIGHPLAGRRNIVLSADPGFRPHPDCLVAPTLAAALALCQAAEKVFVIGGETVFRSTLPLADTLMLTVIEADFAGDAWFPPFEHLPLVMVEERLLARSPGTRLLIFRRRIREGEEQLRHE